MPVGAGSAASEKISWGKYSGNKAQLFDSAQIFDSNQLGHFAKS